MFVQLFQSNPLAALAIILGFVVGITIHEAAHAYSALKLGDDTAYREGRVTLNPLSHLDLLGSMMLFFAGFGWGRPTPVRLDKLKGGVLGPVAVAFAGPASNILIVAICSILAALVAIPVFQSGTYLLFVAAVAYINALLFVFNLLPIPPLDGSKIVFAFLPRSLDPFVRVMNQYGPFILLGLVIVSIWLGLPFLSILLTPVAPILELFGIPPLFGG
ncbi:MAG: site-2 protease family protein [Actinomycetota bacterium]|jgi:Zn-dependent protease|nr:site-2 protease family protein [Rubrobacter sp.]MDQ3506888.1 site-2 protease family protein [Actinomycetota bacterium]